ncbi:ABC transporter permease subunit [Streptococcus sp. X16XC17]|uniref:ABC transporter permease/substrate binding protein n=1 Tax=unclassified Streptococcus TaxID=2608887 RepID=UPI00066FF5C9|nr:MULTISPECIES: ABC transporter permease/substrate binding protein [unclassified Streptococcus]TCD46543.1 ABC transporter permease subunit [Streptococcus sp. X16XC17]
MFNYQLPVAEWVQAFTDWLTQTFSGLFAFIQSVGNSLMGGVTDTLLFVPPIVMIILMTIAAFFISNKKWGLTVFTGLGLLFILNQGLWNDLMNTVTLVIVSSLVSIIIGVPVGIWMAKSSKAAAIINPILDFMQTMPSFVYLIPAVAFFGIGMVPGVFASVIFALPPTVRMTNLAIRQIPEELVEASDSFGSTSRQKLFKVELPLAKPTIFAGINQTIMLVLSMVVTASMIGAPGLGRGVLSALQHADIGAGFVSGIALVILAMIMDRFTQKLNQPTTAKVKKSAKEKKRHKIMTYAVLAGIVLLFAARFISSAMGVTKETVNLGYVQWDSEVASTNVAAEVLREMGYDVKMTPLDNAVLWQSVANGEVDASLSAWLPTTHGALYEQYKDKLVDLGPSLEGVQSGLVVPAYMDVNSIEDLSNQAGKKITGIEPGAGIMTTAQAAIDAYPNLKGWELISASTGAMNIELERAYQNKEDIVITGWSPHWLFSKYDLKYLEDSKKTMGEKESIHTLVRQGFDKDNAEVNAILDNFNWTEEDMESVMFAINEGDSPEKAAKAWIEENRDLVDSWKK